MCGFFDVSRSGYYAYLKCKDTVVKDLPIAEKIRECQERCRQAYGYRRVHIRLERQGINLNPKTVLRVMQKYNLLTVVVGRSSNTYQNIYTNALICSIESLIWGTDISCIPTNKGNCYLSVIRDLYDNSIVAYKLSKDMTVKLVFDTIKVAKKRECHRRATTPQ